MTSCSSTDDGPRLPRATTSTGGPSSIEAPVYRPVRLTFQEGDAAPALSEHPVTGSGYRGELVEVMSALASGRRESLVMPLHETLSIMQTLDTVRATIGLVYPQE